uniref:G protein-coupled receptor n=1 Tax=Panagrellus redivivus TaxID=6233 RepID=A0A7E4VG17_PANRE
MMIVMSSFYQATRVGGFLTIVYLNLEVGVKYAAAASPTEVRLHKMLTKTAISNVISTLVCNRIPVILFYLISFLINIELLNLVTNFMSCLASCEFLIDILMTMYLILPYRRFVVNLLARQKSTVVVISSFLSTRSQ